MEELSAIHLNIWNEASVHSTFSSVSVPLLFLFYPLFSDGSQSQKGGYLVAQFSNMIDIFLVVILIQNQWLRIVQLLTKMVELYQMSSYSLVLSSLLVLHLSSSYHWHYHLLILFSIIFVILSLLPFFLHFRVMRIDIFYLFGLSLHVNLKFVLILLHHALNLSNCLVNHISNEIENVSGASSKNKIK